MLRELVDNVLSGMKAGFKAILNIFKHPNGESRMFNLKGSSKLSATLLALILGASHQSQSLRIDKLNFSDMLQSV